MKTTNNKNMGNSGEKAIGKSKPDIKEKKITKSFNEDDDDDDFDLSLVDDLNSFDEDDEDDDF